MAGRKSKLNAELIEEASGLIKAGNFAVVVCQYLHISQAAYYEWLARGQDDLDNNIKSIYVEFMESIKSAEAEAEIRNVSIIQSAAITTWQAAAWHLERKHPDRWGMHKSQIELTGKDGGPIDIGMDLSKLTDEEVNTVERILAKTIPTP
jgi:hypothetical protein